MARLIAMNIHEYQAKAMFKQAGVPVLRGVHCTSVKEALDAYADLDSKIVAVKSQIHAGGRGKGTLYTPDNRDFVMEGGVKIAFSSEEVENYASNILGNVLVTIQTGEEGKLVQNLYVESGCDIAHEYYLALLVDREKKAVLVMASTEGGMDIEEVAEHNPEAIHKIWADPGVGLLRYQKVNLGKSLGFQGTALKSFVKCLTHLFEMFCEEDCSMVEINPLVLTKNDEIIALDGKVGFDGNAHFRHRELWDEMRDLSEEDEAEIKAAESDLSYVNLDGNIGCLVNGAGLAMATMDVIKLYGGEPANFLDVGGGANEEQVKTAFSIILQDPNVEGILVNIFGGIMRCDIIARGVIAATQALSLSVPLVVRLAGTNVDEGKAILAESTLNIHPADTLAEGAQKIVSLIRGEQ